MTENQLERLREIEELLTIAVDNVATTRWYVERGAESKGFQWLLSGAQRAGEAQRRLKTFVDEQTDGELMLDSPLFDTACAVHGTGHRTDKRCPGCTEEGDVPVPPVTANTMLLSACYRITFACPCGTKVLREDCDIGANEVYGCASVRRALKSGATRRVEEEAAEAEACRR